MNLPALSSTLVALLDGLAAAESDALVIDEAVIESPMEVRLVEEHGQPIVAAAPARSIWRAGFEPVVHRVRIAVTAGAVTPLPESEDHGGRR
jgi:hypothetical protein